MQNMQAAFGENCVGWELKFSHGRDPRIRMTQVEHECSELQVRLRLELLRYYRGCKYGGRIYDAVVNRAGACGSSQPNEYIETK